MGRHDAAEDLAALLVTKKFGRPSAPAAAGEWGWAPVLLRYKRYPNLRRVCESRAGDFRFTSASETDVAIRSSPEGPEADVSEMPASEELWGLFFKLGTLLPARYFPLKASIRCPMLACRCWKRGDCDAHQAQGQATQGRDLSTLAPLRALRVRTHDRAWARRAEGEGVSSCLPSSLDIFHQLPPPATRTV